MIQCWHIIQRYHIVVKMQPRFDTQIYCSILLPCNVVTTIWSWDWNTLTPLMLLYHIEMKLFRELLYQDMGNNSFLDEITHPGCPICQIQLRCKIAEQNFVHKWDWGDAWELRVFFSQKMKHFLHRVRFHFETSEDISMASIFNSWPFFISTKKVGKNTPSCFYLKP